MNKDVGYCKTCFDNIPLIINNKYCKKCSSTLLVDSNYLCKDCRNGMFINSYFDKNISCFFYSGEIQKLIISGKFQSRPSIWKFLAKKMVDVYKKLLYDKDFIIIPVPVSKKRYRQRGFNQANIISVILVKEVYGKIAKDVLIKSSDNQSQAKLNLENRKTNPLGCYRINNKNLINKKHILLIDDVFTTGSTINECSRILKANNALSVTSFTIAKTNLDNL